MRTALRFLAPDSPGATGMASSLRRAVLVALMPRLVRRHHVVELLEMLDGDGTAGADARQVVDGLRRRPTTCLYRSLAGFASLRGAGEPVRFVIGVRVEDGELVAHAWLERDGEPVGEPTDPRDRFAVAFAYPPAGGGRTRTKREARTARELAERIAKEFEAPSVEEVEKDVAVLMKELEAEGLLRGDTHPPP